MQDSNFDAILFKIKDTGAQAAKKASALLEIAGLKTQIVNKKGDINHLYNRMGKTVYDIYTNKEEDQVKSKILDESCEKIDLFKNEIAVLEQKIEELKKSLKSRDEDDVKMPKATCPECDSEVPDDAQFCPKCAAKL